MDKYLMLSFLFFSCFSCDDNKLTRDNGDYIVGYGERVNGEYRCAYVYDKNNYLVKNICQDKTIINGYAIGYYQNGIIKLLALYKNGVLDGNEISYSNIGLIEKIVPYSNGKINGEVRIFYPNGDLKAINLFDNDSLYYVRVYMDTLHLDKFSEELTPIVKLEKDSAKVNDTLKVIIRFPLSKKFDLDTGKYILHYDSQPPEYLKDLNDSIPLPREIVELNGTDWEIRFSSSEVSRDKFYCFITNMEGKRVSNIICRDLIFTD